MQNNQSRGILFLLLSAFFFAAMSAFVRLSGDLPFFQKVVFRNLIAVIVAGGSIAAGRTKLRFSPASRVPLVMRIVLGVVAVFCNYYAIDHLILASSNSLSKLGPFFAILFTVLFLKERVSREQLACIAIALVGSLFLLIPNMGTVGLAAMIGLLGGVSSGGIHVALRMLRRDPEVDSSAIVFLFSAVSLLTALVPSLLFWQHMTGRQVLCLLGAGSASAVAQYCLTAAYRYASPKDISIFDCTQIIFSGLLGYLLFRQIPDTWSLIAYALIITASALLFVHYRRTAAGEQQGAADTEGENNE